jgi:hypothetical protein
MSEVIAAALNTISAGIQGFSMVKSSKNQRSNTEWSLIASNKATNAGFDKSRAMIGGGIILISMIALIFIIIKMNK